MADAVLYEGYLLYPYRKSSGKNRVRWQFGVLAPRAWVEANVPHVDTVAGSVESWFQQTECLAEANADAAVHVRVRFLQVQDKTIQERSAEGTFRSVEALAIGSETHLSFEEAVEREHDLVVSMGEVLGGERAIPFGVPGGSEVQRLTDGDGRELGRVLRTRADVTGVVHLSAARAEAPFPLVRVRVRLENSVTDLDPGRTRDEALRRSLIATHVFIAIAPGSFVSLFDPPQWARAAAAECANVHAFPVLAGEPGRRDLILSAPIVLYDHPAVAPESPGDLFDATEIDEILSLRTLTLTDEEKREARATDPRAAALLDRVDTMPPEIMDRLHGAVRGLSPVTAERDQPDARAVPWWNPGADESVSPGTDAVTVDGLPVSRGSRVRLRPTRSADAHDMFLRGRPARVQAVFLDVDGATHVAVTLEEDEASELHEWYGRFFYFAPDEIEPITEPEGARP